MKLVASHDAVKLLKGRSTTSQLAEGLWGFIREERGGEGVKLSNLYSPSPRTPLGGSTGGLRGVHGGSTVSGGSPGFLRGVQGCRVQGCRAQGLRGSRPQGLRVLGSGYWVLGFKVWGIGPNRCGVIRSQNPLFGFKGGFKPTPLCVKGSK